MLPDLLSAKSIPQLLINIKSLHLTLTVLYMMRMIEMMIIIYLQDTKITINIKCGNAA